MVIDLLLQVLHALVAWFNGIRPAWDVTLPPGVNNLIGMLKGFDQVLPVSEIMTCLTLLLTLLAAFTTVKWSVKLIDWIADVIP